MDAGVLFRLLKKFRPQSAQDSLAPQSQENLQNVIKYNQREKEQCTIKSIAASRIDAQDVHLENQIFQLEQVIKNRTTSALAQER